MKRRIVVSTLLAIVLLLIPSAVLADDPDGGVEVDIGIISGGDVNVDLGIEAGGDVSIDVGTNADVNVNGDNLVNTSVLGNAIDAARPQGDEYRYHLVTQNRDAIVALWDKVGNHMTYDIWVLSSAMERNIIEDNQQQIDLWVANYNRGALEVRLATQEEWVSYLNSQDALLADYDATLAGEIQVANARAYQLEVALWEVEQRAYTNLIIIGSIALAIFIVLGIVIGRLRSKIKYLV